MKTCAQFFSSAKTQLGSKPDGRGVSEFFCKGLALIESGVMFGNYLIDGKHGICCEGVRGYPGCIGIFQPILESVWSEASSVGAMIIKPGMNGAAYPPSAEDEIGRWMKKQYEHLFDKKF